MQKLVLVILVVLGSVLNTPAPIYMVPDGSGGSALVNYAVPNIAELQLLSIPDVNQLQYAVVAGQVDPGDDLGFICVLTNTVSGIDFLKRFPSSASGYSWDKITSTIADLVAKPESYSELSDVDDSAKAEGFLNVYDNVTGNWLSFDIQVATIQNMKDADTSKFDLIFVTEDGRSGQFRLDDASSYTAAQIDEGTVFASDFNAAKVWVRNYDGPIMARWYGMDDTGVTNATTLLQLAINSADTWNKALDLEFGSYLTSATITNVADMFGTFATILVNQTNIVGIQAGFDDGDQNTLLRRKTIWLPIVHDNTKPATGWNAGGVGIRLTSILESEIHIPWVRGFETGVKTVGSNTNGFAYNNVYIGHIHNNKTNLMLYAESGGWCNENNFYGGRLSHISTEGTAVSGTKHILLNTETSHYPNNNKFWGNSIEGNVAEYEIYCFGQDNLFNGLRYETAGGANITFDGSNAKRNVIQYGFQIDAATVTNVNSAIQNTVYTPLDIRIDGGSSTATIALKNAGSSTYPLLFLTEAATDIHNLANDDFTLAMTANNSYYKGIADTTNRFHINHGNGVLTWGNGSAVDTTLQRSGGGLLTTGADFRVDDDLIVNDEIEFTTGGPTIRIGTGAPALSEPNGSLFLRTDGTGPNLYVRENGAWVAK